MNDFDRNVWCLLGLPFDAINLEITVNKVHEAAKNKTPCFISTPNLNFLIASQKDEKFRDSVINSDISIADGKPIIWLARLLDIPLPERVAGSDLIEALIENKAGHKPLKVFFFGGQEGIAEQACEKLNIQNKGLQCVGSHNPGFGTIEDMSSDKIIKKMNESNADFVIVSLGAKKGQAWIERNREKLTAPIISHLGAVVNFITGNVKRSPKLLQKLGLEWLWRIKEEPALWKRYFYDVLSLFYLLIVKVLPYKYLLFRYTSRYNSYDDINIENCIQGDTRIIKITGVINKNNLTKIKDVFRIKGRRSKNIVINIDDLVYLDPSFLGYIFLLYKNLHASKINLIIKTKSILVRRFFNYNNCSYMLS